MKGFGGGMQALMKQANQMQNKMKKVQEELAAKEFEGSAGGGVTAKVNGDNMLTSITINPDVLAAGDAEMLQDLVIAATNEAQKLAKKTHQEEMAKITGGLNMPGMF